MPEGHHLLSLLRMSFSGQVLLIQPSFAFQDLLKVAQGSVFLGLHHETQGVCLAEVLSIHNVAEANGSFAVTA